MTMGPESETDELLRRARAGDPSAINELLDEHRARLRRMVAFRMDQRLAARIDPSDIVQEALAEASRKLPQYLDDLPLPFYPWLRQIAWERLVDLHRRHLDAQKRDVRREDWRFALPDESAVQLAERLYADGSTPSDHLVREELRQRVRSALASLAAPDREVLVLRHLEQLSIAEIASVLNPSLGTVKTRHLRAVQRLRRFLSDDPAEDET